MKTLKYIIYDESLPIIFGEYYKHDNIKCPGEKTSAGFCKVDFNNKTVLVWGESLSLGLKSQKTDSEILKRMFFDC